MTDTHRAHFACWVEQSSPLLKWRRTESPRVGFFRYQPIHYPAKEWGHEDCWEEFDKALPLVRQALDECAHYHYHHHGSALMALFHKEGWKSSPPRSIHGSPQLWLDDQIWANIQKK